MYEGDRALEERGPKPLNPKPWGLLNQCFAGYGLSKKPKTVKP